MKHHSEIHNRRSFRLPGYDYAKVGLYFITICVKDRECSLGKIENDEMILSAIGETANHFWLDIPKHFSHVIINEHVIMPNHVHGIIELTQNNIAGTRHGVSQQKQPITREFGKPITGSVSTIINQYKSSVKRWCNKNNFCHFQWQSRFFDHLIRSEDDYIRISDYIVNNPIKWSRDTPWRVPT
jgi:REP element-mobilizing transposase RayT